MIITKLQGGLGNQLFQWATTYALSKKYNCEYKFEMSYFYSGQRPLMLNNYSKIHLPGSDQTYVFPVVYDDFKYKELGDNCFLFGYWQSEKYFINFKEEIQKILRPTEKEKNSILSLFPILNEECTSLHVRRGDYVNLQDTHPLQTLDYYKSAMNILKPKNVLVFSDDIQWCKENIKIDNVYYIDEPNEIKVLNMMSMCKDNIIANSSFSWWGAWIGNDQNKKVIAPKNWFGPNGPQNFEDIYCTGWIVI